MKNTIAKSDWLMSQQCLAMAWYALRADALPPNEAERFRMQQGQEAGELAGQLFPAGTLIAGGFHHDGVELTRAAIADTGRCSFFEATVLAEPFIAKADVLVRLDGGWHVLEVKSSFSDTKDLDELVDDLACTVMVFRRASKPETVWIWCWFRSRVVEPGGRLTEMLNDSAR